MAHPTGGGVGHGGTDDATERDGADDARPQGALSVQPEYKGAVLNRLKTVRGHLDGTIRMVEDDTYCVDVMKQLSALQASIERANRLLLQNHLETCFSKAVAGGEGEAAISELVDALKFSPALTGADFAAGLVEAGRSAGPTSST